MSSPVKFVSWGTAGQLGALRITPRPGLYRVEANDRNTRLFAVSPAHRRSLGSVRPNVRPWWKVALATGVVGGAILGLYFVVDKAAGGRP